MALTVIVEDGTGLSDANSYADVISADAYFESRPRSDAWVSLDEDLKAQYLVHATRVLDTSIRWDGEALTTTQALAFPRLIDFETIAVPVYLKHALFELAWVLKDTDVTAQPATTGITSLKVGPIEIQSDAIRPQPIIPRFIADLVSRYGHPRASGSSVRLTRR